MEQLQLDLGLVELEYANLPVRSWIRRDRRGSGGGGGTLRCSLLGVLSAVLDLESPLGQLGARCVTRQQQLLQVIGHGLALREVLDSECRLASFFLGLDSTHTHTRYTRDTHTHTRDTRLRV